MGPYDAMTMEQLQAEFINLGAQLAQTNDARAQVMAIMEQRKADALAAAGVGKLSPLQKDALLCALQNDPSINPNVKAVASVVVP